MLSHLFRLTGLLYSALLVLALAPASALAAPVAAKTLNIGVARSLPLGSTVTLKGTVTVPSGVFASGTFDQGFAIQDQTGGIYVSVAVDLGLQLRDQVEVTGQLADSAGLLILQANAADVKRKGNGHPIATTTVATGALSEATEGQLVAITGVLTAPVGDDLPYGYRLFVNDGSGAAQVFVYASTGIDLSGLLVGQTVRVIGFSAQFDDHYELNPRLPGDISVN